jgi:YD repeat-containing protein
MDEWQEEPEDASFGPLETGAGGTMNESQEEQGDASLRPLAIGAGAAVLVILVLLGIAVHVVSHRKNRPPAAVPAAQTPSDRAETAALPGTQLHAMQPTTSPAALPQESAPTRILLFSPEGRLVRLTDRAGEDTSYEYDTQGGLALVWGPNGAVRFTHDAHGNRVSMEDRSGKTEYGYDAFDRLQRVTQVRSPVKHIACEYDPWGCVTKVQVLNAREQPEYAITFAYNEMGLLRTVEDACGKVDFEYDPQKGQAVRALPDGVRTTFTYSAAGALVSLQHQGADGAVIASPNARDRPGESRSRAVEKAATGRAERSQAREEAGEPGLSLPPDTRFVYDGDGAAIARHTPAGTVHYISAPLPPAGRVVGEYLSDGRLTRVFVIMERLSLEHSPNPGTHYYLEDDEAGPGAALACRMATARSAYEEDPLNAPAAAPVTPRTSVAPSLPARVLVGGVNARDPAISAEARRYFGPDAIGLNVNSGPMTGIGDMLWAAADQVFGGHATRTADRLWSRLRATPDVDLLAVHSHAAITVGNLSGRIDEALANGSMRIGQVVFLGANPDRHLTGVLEKRHVPYTVRTDPYDPVGIMTTPNAELGGRVAAVIPQVDWIPFGRHLVAGLWKLGAVESALPLVPGPYSFRYHSFEHLLGDADGPGAAGAQDRLLPLAMDEARRPWWAGLGQAEKSGGMAAGLGGWLGRFFEQTERRLGGVDLNAKAEVAGALGDLEGAVFDPETQRLVLVGDGNPALPAVKPEHLAIGILCVLGPRPCDPQFSLDPADETNPRGPWLKAKYIPAERLSGTDFGRILFDADWRMKQYSFGVVVDADGNVVKKPSGVPGFKSVAELTLDAKQGKAGEDEFTRFWFTVEKVKMSRSGQGFVFDEVRMRIRAKKQVQGPDGRLIDVETETPIPTQFANTFTTLYDQIAAESPCVAEVRGLAKVVALAKWLKEQRVPVDMKWVLEKARLPAKTVDRVTALSAMHERKEEAPFREGSFFGVRTTVRQVHLFGGVDLTVKLEYGADGRRAARLEEAVRKAMRASGDAPAFQVEADGRPMQCHVVVPARPDRPTAPARERGPSGITYTKNAAGKAASAVDRDDTRAEYRYNAEGRLDRIELRTRGGEKAVATRVTNGMSLEMTTPTSHQVRFDFAADGRTETISVDGEEFATCTYDQAAQTIHVHYRHGYEETISLDAQGRPREYRRAAPAAQAEPVVLEYDRDGHLSGIRSAGLGQIRLNYDGGRLRSVETPRGRTEYAYDAAGRLRTLSGPEELAMERRYAGDRLQRVAVSLGQMRGEIELDQGRLAASTDATGRRTRYEYDVAGRLRSVVSSDGAAMHFSYDDQGRPALIRPADGPQVRCTYESEAQAKATIDLPNVKKR